jgi:hypothetical protein
MNMALFCVVAPCTAVEVFRIALMLEAASTSETSVHFHQPSRHNNPEDSHRNTPCACFYYGLLFHVQSTQLFVHILPSSLLYLFVISMKLTFRNITLSV